MSGPTLLRPPGLTITNSEKVQFHHKKIYARHGFVTVIKTAQTEQTKMSQGGFVETKNNGKLLTIGRCGAKLQCQPDQFACSDAKQ